MSEGFSIYILWKLTLNLRCDCTDLVHVVAMVDILAKNMALMLPFHFWVNYQFNLRHLETGNLSKLKRFVTVSVKYNVRSFQNMETFFPPMTFHWLQ